MMRGVFHQSEKGLIAIRKSIVGLVGGGSGAIPSFIYS